MKNETRNLWAMALAGFLIGLLVTTMFSVRAQRVDGEDRDSLEGIEEQLSEALERNRDLEARINAAGERTRELETVAREERETISRLEESDNRSRAGLERIESILVDGNDIIDELIRFFETYED